MTGGDILWGATKGMIAGMAFLVVMLMFGLIKSWLALFMPVVMFVIALMFASLAMFFASKAPAYDFFSYYFTLVIAPMFLFSGIFFPIENLPEILQKLAWFMPLVHFVRVSRGLILGDTSWFSPDDILWLLVFTPIIVMLAVNGVRKRVVN